MISEFWCHLISNDAIEDIEGGARNQHLNTDVGLEFPGC